jgi:iron complex outermembrane receptor protein
MSSFVFAQQKTVATKNQTEKDSVVTLTAAEVTAIRAGVNAPFTKETITQKELAHKNFGQDLPFLLNQTPSVVVNSDAGNGIGYTGIRIRGTDATRVNITLNGVPFNDAESQGTFFVDLPDIISSASSIQIQRGVGSSSNGTGAFGASVHLSTNDGKTAGTTFSNSYGSFNSHKHTLEFNSGNLNGFSSSVRLSSIQSDGYIDRASSNLQSLYLSNSFATDRSNLKFNVISGKERTYQAWNGVSQEDLKAGNRTINYAGTERPGDPYNNEVDKYKQTHYQLIYNRGRAGHLLFNTTFFLTRGKGYYEEYRADEAYSKYGLSNPSTTGTTSDFVRQLWLDNYFFGNNFSFQFKQKKTDFTIGGTATRYLGDHYGKLIWASNGLTSLKDWYNLDANKNEAALFLKQQTTFNNKWVLYYDIQARKVWHNIYGFRDNPTIVLKKEFAFLNPKIGFRYKSKGWNNYLSLGVAGKEPNRDDFEASISEQPKAERLYDIETGTEKTIGKINVGATLYYMRYRNQLILTGKINDVGAYTRTNVPNSYRTGVELTANSKINDWFSFNANVSLSQNKVLDFKEYIDNYDLGGQQINQYSKTNLALSPTVVSSTTLTFIPIENSSLSLMSKYVGKQYLDNTQQSDKMLNSFFVQDAVFNWELKTKCPYKTTLQFQVNNLLNRKYEPSGYTYSYIYGGETVKANYYYPMAGINFMAGIVIKK